jgi:hypothetical protein
VRLPKADHVRIDERKVRDYLLSKAHPVGRFKARMFGALGFDEATIGAFVAEVRRIAAEGNISGVDDIEFGRKYTVPGELRGPGGSARVVRCGSRRWARRVSGSSPFVRSNYDIRSPGDRRSRA